MKKPLVVGITGGSASGKTHFIRSLIHHFSKEELCLISQDEYYREKQYQPLDEKGIENFDTPESIDAQHFHKDLSDLIEGKTIQKKEYTFNNPLVEPKTLTFTPAPIIVVEGIFVFYFPEIAKLLDLKIFLDAKEFIKLKRRITRDQQERGYDLDDVLYRYEYHVSPTYEKYIQPYKHDADLVIPNNRNFDRAMEVLVKYLKSSL